MSYILVADDDPRRVRVAQRWLEEAGYIVQVVPDPRGAPGVNNPPSSASGASLRVGGLVVDAVGHRVVVDDQEVRLTVAEFRILTVLASAPNHARTRAELLSHHGTVADVAPAHAAAGRGGAARTTARRAASARAVDGHIRRLRQKIGPDRIETVHGIGYRLPSA